MTAIVNGNEIVLTGTVGGYYWGEDGFSSADVFMALLVVGHDQDVVIRVNSGGGAASEGAAIHSILSRHGGKVDVVIEGWAASAASVLAMAGHTITMAVGAVMMIHEPSQITLGDTVDHQRTISQLNAIGDASAEIYALRTGKTAAEMRQLMKVETWMTGQQAVDAGFADRVSAANDNPEPIAFAIQSYSNVPQNIAAMAAARGWQPRANNRASHQSTTKSNRRKDLSVTTKTNAELFEQATQEVAARMKAIMRADEAQGREKMAEYLAYETTMTAEEAVALLRVAPKATEDEEDDPFKQLERRRLGGAENSRTNGAGLSGSSHSAKSAGPNLVANMKRRHGIKE
ncbi:head maturation protease, ClpP-related [Rhizobium leguminosarum]|uniref:head maturation protease, ClpP-related n=1 Tax=Rhizobium leguminosarum TaxID=384 RepID=UPI0014413112|nr:head maturation protease, ClpP-related [Rhizobium leguminosarum]NKJ79642.1 Clp protease ClpP [Rhizobium leguminosarum bv. viciae]